MNCRVCGSSELRLYYTQGNRSEYKFYKCKNCSNVNYDLSGGLYQEKYIEEYSDPIDPAKNRGKFASYNFLKKHIPNKGKLLDIGCFNGAMLMRAQKDGFEVEGIEISDFYAKKLWEVAKINVIVGNFLELDINDNTKYDVVIIRHVLEHLHDPVLAMTKINQLLKSSGYVLLEFPNIEGIQLKFKRFLDKSGIKKKKYKHDYAPAHCNEFSRKSFTVLTKKTNFKILKWGTYSTKPFLNRFFSLFPIGSKVRTLIQKTSDI